MKETAMILFNIKELEKQLIEEEVSDKMVFNYLLTYLVITTITAYFNNDNPMWLERAQLIVSLITLIWGIRKTFSINGDGDNRDYFKRLISLSFVAGIRVMVFALIILFIYNFLHEILQATGVTSVISSLYENLLILGGLLLGTGYYYFILLSSFKRVNLVEGSVERKKKT